MTKQLKAIHALVLIIIVDPKFVLKLDFEARTMLSHRRTEQGNEGMLDDEPCQLAHGSITDCAGAGNRSRLIRCCTCFGDIDITQRLSATSCANHRFTGKEDDIQVGLIYPCSLCTSSMQNLMFERSPQ
jgi:hypothetical protein